MTRAQLPGDSQREPPEILPPTPGNPAEPPQESPPGNPRPDVPPPINDPVEPDTPRELPPDAPDELPQRGPRTPPVNQSLATTVLQRTGPCMRVDMMTALPALS